MRIAPETPLPQPISDHHIQREPRRLILRIERVPQLRFHPQHRKIPRRHPLILNPRWLRCTRQIHRPEHLQHNILKNSRTLQILKLRNRDARVRRARARQIVFDPHQFLGVRIPQRMQQRRVDQAENRRRRSDPQRHRQNRNRRKARRLRKHAQRVAQILNQVFTERQPLLGVIILSHCPHPAEPQHRLAPRLLCGHAGAQVLRGLQSDVLLHLFAQSPIALPSGNEICQTSQETSEEFHGRSSAFTSKNLVTSAVVCSQFRVSASNCFRPAWVRR